MHDAGSILEVAQSAKKSPLSIEPEASLSYSQDPTIPDIDG